MSKVKIPTVSEDRISRLYFKALIEALQNPGCTCKTCTIMREIAKLLTEE